MSDLTEQEVIDRMITSLREAMDASKALAIKSVRGPSYQKLREHLGLIEGCCKQLSVFREDTRYLEIGRGMAYYHERAGGWLRGHRVMGVKVFNSQGDLNRMFVALYVQLEAILTGIQMMLDAKTGTRGIIVPEIAETRRIGRPAFQFDKPKQQLILPAKYARIG